MGSNQPEVVSNKVPSKIACKSSTYLIAPSDYEHIYCDKAILTRRRIKIDDHQNIVLSDFVTKAVIDHINRQDDKYIR